MKQLALFLLLIWPGSTVWADAQPTCEQRLLSIDQEVDSLLLRFPPAQWSAEEGCASLERQLLAALGVDCTLPDTVLAEVCHRVGVFWINEHGDFARARHHYRQALHLRRAYLPASHADIIKGYNNLGSCYLTMTQRGQGFFLDSARWALTQAISLNLRRAEPTETLSRSYIYLSRVASELGDQDNACLYLQAAIEQLQQDSTQAWRLAITHNDLAIQLGQKAVTADSALYHARQAIDYYQHRPLSSWRDSLALGDWYQSAGTAHLKLGQNQAALESYQRALALKQPYEPYLPEAVAALLSDQAVVHNRLQQPQAAIILLERAIALNQSQRYAPALAGNYDNLGDAWLARGDHRRALQAYQQAVAHFVPGFDPQQLSQNPPIAGEVFYDPIGLLGSLAAKANTWWRYAQANPQDSAALTEAYRSFCSTDSLIQVIRQSYQADGSKEALVGLTKPIYERAIATCLARYRQGGDSSALYQALAWAENSKAVILLDAVAQSRLIGRKLEQDKQQELRLVRERKVYYEKLLAQGKASELSLGDSVIRYRQGEAAWLATLGSRQSTNRWGAHFEASSLPGPDQGWLEYFVGDSSLFLFLVTQRGVQVEVVAHDFPLQTQVDSLRQLVGTPQALDDLDGSLPPLARLAASLYQRLLVPLGDLTALPHHLTIVRDDILELLPFEVLLTQPIAAETPLAQWPYLIRKKVISYAFSAQLQQTFESNQIDPQRGLLALAPVNGQGGERALTPLYATREEVSQVAELWPGTQRVLLDEAATRSQFLAEAPHYAMIYLASHGLLHEKDPRFNGLAFADSVLYLADLAPLRLHAEMVVLRACESGVGRLVPGEGVISLGHGFARTGAKSVFLTQWVVPDATRFMTTFLKHLKEGMPKDLALREAKMALLDQAHPFFWAAAEIRGDMRPLGDWPQTSALSSGWLLWLGLIVLSTGAGYLVYARRQQRGRSSGRLEGPFARVDRFLAKGEK